MPDAEAASLFLFLLLLGGEEEEEEHTVLSLSVPGLGVLLLVEELGRGVEGIGIYKGMV